MGDLRIEEVAPDHWSAWRDLRLRSLRDAPDAFGSTYRREVAFVESDWRSRLDVTSGPDVIAYADDRPVGLGAGWRDEPGQLMVVAMWTEPAWRGRGVGRQVLDHVVGWGAARHLRVHLWVADANPAARRLYERYGLRPDGRTMPLRDGSPFTASHLILATEPAGPTGSAC